eukprot:CAMPEP_0185594720 /NCGR_PEP_ID=MMETSP0434-20130131/75944_1 /TAXON_ID=626734 ORGANISM="Favella taraikaensis, Strain Fe Narragansett Bay" /NCGR_SAMPLE_ID=MMETSP0434 /ASSEMBLY_ACC=CAM_ASM_000379 /LENGTH=50 /DNA_ID=CAMNT_0028222245 /DNA_START=1041 /DNA_END=1193 /DNA_ORIENTATION=+
MQKNSVERQGQQNQQQTRESVALPNLQDKSQLSGFRVIDEIEQINDRVAK